MKCKYESIKEYLKISGTSMKAFADLIQVDQMTLYRWLNGIHTMRAKTAKKIERKTNGKIKAEDLI